jgi:hypothetical protein
MEPFESQNLKDDDGQVIDSFLIETDAPPPLSEALEPIVVKGETKVDKYTRLLSGEVTMGIDWEPVQILPVDATRLDLVLRVYSPTAIDTDGIRFSDERGLVRTGGKVLHGDMLNLADHTGAVWVIPAGDSSGLASAPVSIEWWATAGPTPIDYSEAFV